MALRSVAVGGRRPLRNSALVIIGPQGFQEPMTMYAGGDGEDLHCKCCCDLSLEATMATVSEERAHAFTAEELDNLVDGVLPQYTLLYGPPEKQTEHPLPQEMGGPALLEQEDGGGPAGDGLPMWKRCPSHHDLPDVPDPGGGISGVGWALEGITAAARGRVQSHAADSVRFTRRLGGGSGLWVPLGQGEHGRVDPLLVKLCGTRTPIVVVAIYN
ncbi:hypothetical protein NDU88_000318 [Pleurodeles waltl]|uniref:Uncharacterized protein n=1 Tax=Pleurodeles waltl TaxID=8319 RepID=A0AAV7UQZ3_PLEWA|nr:hypothetical protein NDU88_000318 [Pleurodeles waltl]